MRKLFAPVLAILLWIVASPVIAQDFDKKIVVKVTDATTGRAVSGAQVNLRGLIINKSGTTNADGIATFEWVLVGRSAEIRIEVTESWGHYPFRSSFAITSNQNEYTIPVSLTSSYLRFSVKTLDAATGQAVANAYVEILLYDAKGNTGSTNNAGELVLDVQVLSKFPFLNIKAQKDGYETTQVKVDLDEKVGQYPVTISMKRLNEVKLLQVTVVDESNNPVPEARVFASSNTSGQGYWGNTDASGVATVICKTGGSFTVHVTHSNFNRAEGEITINKFAEQEVYPMHFQLKRKKSLLRDVRVIVLDGSNNKPIPKAMVQSPGSTGITNTIGEAYLEKVVALGETGSLTVLASGYEEKTVSYIGGGENYRYSPPAEDKVYVRLTKEKTADVKLVIEVLDKATDRPIGKASVSIKNKNGTMIMSGKSTNVKGQAEMMLGKKEWANAPFRVMAKAKGYSEQWSDITSDYLKADNDPLFFTIFLEREKTSAQSGEVKYGPFSANLLQWQSTGVQVKKGDMFRVEYDTSSKISYTNSQGQLTYVGPDGHGYWGWFVLAAKINDDIFHVGSRGGATATSDGTIMLGAPRVTSFHEGDGSNCSGSWSVYIYVRKQK